MSTEITPTPPSQPMGGNTTATLNNGGLCSPDETRQIIAGLLATPAWISPKYFYDPLGSQLFELITTLPEYYPTRVERDIYARYLPAIAERVGVGGALIDLGAGNCAKAEALFAALRPAQYVAVDISSEFLTSALRGLRQRHPGIDMLNVAMDFSSVFALPPTVNKVNRLILYPGSSIGNFTPAEAGALLRQIHRECGVGGHLLIGVDLLKDRAILETAYDEPLGVTAAFNLNVLNHLNARIGCDFDTTDWRHRAFFNARESRIEMHLEARHGQTVSWPGGRREFALGERIHTENSYKYDLDGFRRLLSASGFGEIHAWTDPSRWFAVVLARANRNMANKT